MDWVDRQRLWFTSVTAVVWMLSSSSSEQKKHSDGQTGRIGLLEILLVVSLPHSTQHLEERERQTLFLFTNKDTTYSVEENCVFQNNPIAYNEKHTETFYSKKLYWHVLVDFEKLEKVLLSLFYVSSYKQMFLSW